MHMIGMPMMDRKESISKLDILVASSRMAIIIKMKDATVPRTQIAASTAFCGRGSLVSVDCDI
jgi:hypothetical protein